MSVFRLAQSKTFTQICLFNPLLNFSGKHSAILHLPHADYLCTNIHQLSACEQSATCFEPTCGLDTALHGIIHFIWHVSWDVGNLPDSRALSWLSLCMSSACLCSSLLFWSNHRLFALLTLWTVFTACRHTEHTLHQRNHNKRFYFFLFII